MKDTSTTEYLSKVKSLTLREESKTRMRNELSTFADFHAVRVAEDSRLLMQVQSHSVFTLFTNPKLRIMKAALLIALMIGSGASSFAAQGAVPGEFLYPIKVGVNENVRSAFAVNANSEAQLQAELLAERMSEAEVLASRGELEGETAAQVRTNIAAQFEKTQLASLQADADTNAEVTSSISNTLVAFENNLSSFGSSISQNVAADFQSDVAMRLNTFASLNGSTNAKMSGDQMGTSMMMAAEIDAATLLETAEDKVEKLTKLIKDNASEFSASVKASFEADLKVAAEHVADAHASLKANAEADAKASVDKAYEAIGKIESALSLLGSVEIDDTGTIIDIDFNGNAGSGAVNGSNDDGTTDSGTLNIGGGTSVGGGLTVCPMDAKMCPDGSSVGRQGPSCEFAPCPL